MSGNINNSRASKGKGIGRKGERASEANRKLMENVLRDGIDEDEMRFCQIQKIYGNGWFGVKLTDGRETKAMIRDLLASKKGTPVAIGTVVLAHLPDWKKDALTNNQKPRAFIEGVLEDPHVHLLKHRGVLPEWMGLVKSADGEEEKKDDGYEFVSEEATKLIAQDGDEDEDEEDNTTNAVITPTAATTSRAQTKKARELAISSARDKKEDFNIDDI